MLLAHLVIGRGYRALVVWDLAAFSIPKEQMREKVARALKLKKKNKKVTAFSSLSIGKRRRYVRTSIFLEVFFSFHVSVLRALRYTLCQMLALIFVDTLRFREISNKIATKSYITKRNMIFIASREMLH